MKEEKQNKRKRGEELTRGLTLKDPASRIAPITGTFRSLCLQKALANFPQSLCCNRPYIYCVLCSLRLHPDFLSYNPNAVTISEVLPAVSNFPRTLFIQNLESCDVLQEHSLLIAVSWRCIVFFFQSFEGGGVYIFSCT